MVNSIIMMGMIALVGGALVAAAFNTKRLIIWENRVLTSIADSVREYREALEEEQYLLEQSGKKKPQVLVARQLQTRQSKRDHAA